MINCIAIDRDSDALTVLSSQIEKIPFLSLKGTFTNPMEANGLLAHRGADLVFADPDMEPINGVDFVRSMVNRPLVVFITHNRSFAVEAYNEGVLDYIVKPLTLDRLVRVANKAYQLIMPAERDTTHASPAMVATPFLFVKVDNRMQRFNTDDILFIEGCSDYARVYTSGAKPALVSLNLKHIERKLPPGNFCRVHRSYIVSLNRIDSIERKRIRIGERLIPVSDSYYPLLLQAIDAAIPA
ncbi:MAG: LytTR family DNA-binding domain-containing protein [Bacteroidales bacterium]|jgi:DNA-binding LytR/AlgR family response regulator|nr:LytTR family DNA-binding domain-containing protein [Bacteroidales bacterium]